MVNNFMSKGKVKYRIAIYTSLLLSFCFSVALWGEETFAMGSSLATKILSNQRGLHGYQKKEIESFLDSIGCSKEYGRDIRRTSNGSSLIFFSRKYKKAVMVSCDGEIRKIDLPGSRAWINDQLEIIAWSEDKETFFASGLRQEGILNMYGTDPGGKYFLARPRWYPAKPMSELTQIYSIDNPRSPLYEIRMKDPNSRIFVKNEKVILIGKAPENANILMCYFFSEQGAKLIKVDEKEIIRPQEATSPFNVVDINPWADEILVVDSRDFPLRSKWYVFHIETQQMEYIEKSFSFGFYLQCDILRRVEAQRQQQ
jgi:hypothetical protein